MEPKLKMQALLFIGLSVNIAAIMGTRLPIERLLARSLPSGSNLVPISPISLYNNKQSTIESAWLKLSVGNSLNQF